MRRFNYIEDYGLIGITIKGYITQLYKEINLLIDSHPIYTKALKVIEHFKFKYENLSEVSAAILKDLLQPYSVEYCMEHGKYPSDASKIGVEFEKDLNIIFKLEEELKLIALEKWETELTNFDNIVNGEDFIIVGHASRKLPGIPENYNYKTGKLSKQYLSCSVFSDKELNTFDEQKVVYVTNVDRNNYISSSNDDSLTSETSYPIFETLKEIELNGVIHYIKSGFTNDRNRAVTTISTPRLIETLSIEREIEENGSLFEYEDILTNEVVLDRTNTKVFGALLLGNGCDLLIDEYLYLKKNNIEFKCLNKGLYKQKYGIDMYNEKEYNEFLKSISKLYVNINNGKYTTEELLGYYNEVVIPMKYSPEIIDIIKQSLGNLEFEEHNFKNR
ncbi:MAG: hypothetical protein E7170_02040 [Firmicutes bacterium]|nr:hypothetical protein [Bacillota bacterium]